MLNYKFSRCSDPDNSRKTEEELKTKTETAVKRVINCLKEEKLEIAQEKSEALLLAKEKKLKIKNLG